MPTSIGKGFMLTIIIIVLIVLLVLGFLGRGRFMR